LFEYFKYYTQIKILGFVFESTQTKTIKFVLRSFSHFNVKLHFMAKLNITFLDVIINLLPIVLLFFYFVFPNPFATFATTFLGKTVLVVFILLFSYISIWLGILYCILLILYLQQIHNPHQTTVSNNYFQLMANLVGPVRSTTPPSISTPPLSKSISYPSKKPSAQQSVIATQASSLHPLASLYPATLSPLPNQTPPVRISAPAASTPPQPFNRLVKPPVQVTTTTTT